MVRALVQKDLEVRLTEALPWVLCKYPDLEWSWVTNQLKLKDVQNRLGFLVGIAKDVAASKQRSALRPISVAETALEHSRLDREDTLCRDSMPDAERRWLKANRSKGRLIARAAKKRRRGSTPRTPVACGRC